MPATALDDRMLRSLPPNTDTPDLLMPGLVARKRDRCVMRQSSGFSCWTDLPARHWAPCPWPGCTAGTCKPWWMPWRGAGRKWRVYGP